jgi:magnesium chelatase subunit H
VQETYLSFTSIGYNIPSIPLQERRSNRIIDIPSLKKDPALVDAVVSTVGFPLVGGPAGTMEGGRQAEVAKQILSAKNVPYCVSAPLLIQVGPGFRA